MGIIGFIGEKAADAIKDTVEEAAKTAVVGTVIATIDVVRVHHIKGQMKQINKEIKKNNKLLKKNKALLSNNNVDSSNMHSNDSQQNEVFHLPDYNSKNN